MSGPVWVARVDRELIEPEPAGSVAAALGREDDGGDAVVEREDAASTPPHLDERRERAIDIALDHLAGHCARVDVLAIADVDANVTHAPFRSAEGEDVARKKPARIA